MSDLLPNKNQLLLIDAMQKLTSLAHLVLIGRHDTQYGKKVKDEVDDRQLTSFVHFFGPSSQEELPVLINSLDIFCYASKSEGLPVSLLEAMACRKPCISTRNLGTEAIIKNGVDGILLDNNTFEDMALGITKVIENENFSNQLSNNARLKVETSFNTESQAESYKRLYMKG